jgi:hypothetical protein
MIASFENDNQLYKDSCGYSFINLPHNRKMRLLNSGKIV